MNVRSRVVVARLAFAFVALSACLFAWRAGGGADRITPPPHPDEQATSSTDASAPSSPAPAAGTEAFEVHQRLTDLTPFETTPNGRNLGDSPIWKAHWRKMRAPWAKGPHVVSVALRTSSFETQWVTPLGAGKEWTPDARVWNLNEGSYDQRDAFVAPLNGTLAFRIDVPRGGRLTFSEGTLNAMRDAVVHSITLTTKQAPAREIYRHRLSPASARRWTDASVDLSTYAGQNVELRLVTEAVPATRDELAVAARQREAARRAEREALDGGAPDASDPDGGVAKEELLATPSEPIALWGAPTLLTRAVPRVAYDVVWIVVDALRPDVIASFHDDAEDAKRQAASEPPLEASLPKIPGLTPNIDALAKRGVRFTHAYSAGSWTRPGTLAMLSGARSSELGLDTERWALFGADSARFYASDPPLLPLMARRSGMSTHAFVNNYFMLGYAPVGIDLGFEHVADHRYRTRDTLEVTRDTTTFIASHRDTRFFLFANYNSPHEPYDPPPAMLERVPPPPAGPEDKTTRLYLAEAAKDDAAIGAVLEAISDAGLRDRTIVIVTADHGETLSSAHGGTSALDRMPVRFHHAVSNYEETARIPILVVAPGLLPENRAVTARVSNVDLAPTVTELLGLEAHPRASGESLVALANGQNEPDERVVVTEGRGTRAVMHGRYRLLVREGLARTTMFADHTAVASEELYDLEVDPGERHDLARERPELVEEMRARLVAAEANVPVAGSVAATARADDGGTLPTIHLRFAGGGSSAHRVSGTFRAGDAKNPARSFVIEPFPRGGERAKMNGEKAEVSFTTNAAFTVGFDITIDPPTLPVTWELYLDDHAWPDDTVFGGPFGLLSTSLRRGITTDEERAAAASAFVPTIDPRRDLGMFVSRERPNAAARDEGESAEAAEETARLLREWGYVTR